MGFAPIVHEGETMVEVYFPQGTHWYDLRSHQKYEAGVSSVNADDEVPIFVRSGRTIVMQDMAETNRTTVDMYENAISIFVALDENDSSRGSLYLDDGLSLNPESTYTTFSYEAST